MLAELVFFALPNVMAPSPEPEEPDYTPVPFTQTIPGDASFPWTACDDTEDCAKWAKKKCIEEGSTVESSHFDILSTKPCTVTCRNGLGFAVTGCDVVVKPLPKPKV